MAQLPRYLVDNDWVQVSPDNTAPFRAQNNSEFTVLVHYAAAKPPARGQAGEKAYVDGAVVLKPGEWFGRTVEAPVEILWGKLQQANNNSGINSQAAIAVYSPV